MIMRTSDIIKEIHQLPFQKRMYIVEKTLESIRKEEKKKELSQAASALYNDYSKDPELTAFTDVDFDDFYETK